MIYVFDDLYGLHLTLYSLGCNDKWIDYKKQES